MAPVQAPNTVRASVNYYLPVDQGGSDVLYSGTAGSYRRKYDVQEIDIFDIRSSDEAFSLDKQGFELVTHRILEQEATDWGTIKTVVYYETSGLLQRVTGATRVQPFSHIMRTQTWDSAVEASESLGDRDPFPARAPARFIHVDQSYNGALEVLKDNLSPADAEKLAKTRWGIINVWRPLNQVVRREPVAVCDATTILEADLRPIQTFLPPTGSRTCQDVSKGRGFETWQLAFDPGHKWYYAAKMTPGEAILIKCYDSKSDGRARCTPHTAFFTEDDSGPPRQSIEVRCLVFWENDAA